MVRKKTAQTPSLKGNITLKLEDLTMLQNGVIKRYATDTGLASDEVSKQFNSNFKNPYYSDFLTHIESKGFYLGISSKNPKTLSEIFYFTKEIRNNGYGSFRKQLINTLAKYAFDKEIGEIVITKEESLINKISGYWECYYDKDGTFKESIQSHGKATLGIIAITIYGDNINNTSVRYFQNKSWGYGTVMIFGTNFVFRLTNEKNLEPTMQIMNCGRNIDDFTSHVREAAGIFLHINEKSYPKQGKCLMLYYDSDELFEKFGLKHIDINSAAFYEKFTSGDNDFGLLQIDKDNLDKLVRNIRHKKIKNFFEKGTNTSFTHINEFDSMDN